MSQKVAINPQERLINLIIDLLNSKRPIDFARYQDREEWGDERTFRRMRALLNDVWTRRNQTPLFEVVDSDGKPKQRGDGRFLKLVDKSIQSSRVEQMAVMPALMQMLQTLKGTILHDEFNPLYKNWYSDLKGSAKRHFDRTEKKFYCFNKGSKRYDLPNRSAILEETYDSLLKEQLLEIRFRRKSAEKSNVVMPLSLVMFNTGLYLLCRFQVQDDPKKVYSFALEKLISAKSLRGKNFKYPHDFDPSDHFDGDFGFIRTADKTHKVILEYEKTSWVRNYLHDRRWTGQEQYVEVEGKEQFQMQVSDLREVTSWVLPLCDQVEILSPSELKEGIQKKAQMILKKNG